MVSQPKPKTDKSPYFDLAEKNNIKIDFRPFIHVEGVSTKEFRAQRIDILAHTAVVFTSRTAIDHYFNIAKETRVTIPDSMKYFCISEATANYLQKYITYRKRKVFFSSGRFPELVDVMKKHKTENYLIPLSEVHKSEIPELMSKSKLKFTEAILYRTVSSDLSDLKEIDYDILVFFSPSGIKSLLHNFPNWNQKDTKIACFGPTTAKAVQKAGYRLDIEAPLPKAPSMTMALDMFIKEHNKKK